MTSKRQNISSSCTAGGARDYAKLIPELRLLQTAIKRLEDAIAAVNCGEKGATRPGAFLFELLGSVQINKDTVFEVLHMLDAAVDLLEDDGVGQMRRCAPSCPISALTGCTSLDAIPSVSRSTFTSHGDRLSDLSEVAARHSL